MRRRAPLASPSPFATHHLDPRAPQVRFEVRGEPEQAPQVAFNGPRTSIMLKVPGPCRTLAAPHASRLTTPCPVHSTPHQRGPITSRTSCRVWSDELRGDELRGGGRRLPLVPVGLDQLAAEGQQQRPNQHLVERRTLVDGRRALAARRGRSGSRPAALSCACRACPEELSRGGWGGWVGGGGRLGLRRAHMPAVLASLSARGPDHPRRTLEVRGEAKGVSGSTATTCVYIRSGSAMSYKV